MTLLWLALAPTAAEVAAGGWLDAIDISQVSAWSIVAIFVIAILRGWLVPRRTLMDRVEDKEATIKDKNLTIAAKDATIAAKDVEVASWRDAATTSQGQVNELLEAGRTTQHVITSLSEAVDGRRPEAPR